MSLASPDRSAIDDYHGTAVADPYRWLEDGDSAAVQAWTDRQNARCRAFLKAIPGRDPLHGRLRELLQVGTQSAPVVRIARDGRRLYFHFRRDGERDQGVFYVREGLAGVDRALIDPGTEFDDPTISIAWTAPSPDGSLLAWGRSEGGSEENALHIRDTVSGRDLDYAIPRTRFVSIAWQPHGRGFYYTRYPRPGTVSSGDENYHRRVFLHTIGTDPDRDPVVFPGPDDGHPVCAKTDSPGVFLSPNGRWLVVRLHQGAHKSAVYFTDLSAGKPGRWIKVAAQMDATYKPVPRDDALYLVTTEDAPHARLVAVDYRRRQRSAWRLVVPECDDVLRSVTIVGDVIVANYWRDAATHLERFGCDGRPLGPIALPATGTATVHGRHDGTVAYVRFTSFVDPGTVIRYSLDTAEATVWAETPRPPQLPPIEISRAYAESRDGTRIPMFVIQREGTARDGDNATILTGYGGFGVCAGPVYAANALAAVEAGVVWVQAVLRGGGEFGAQWHRDGMLSKKQNVFDDFIACAEELVRTGVTKPSRLGIAGSSNGGLLTAAVATQRPELFRAVLCDVPLTDMLRYQHFRLGKLWVSEYGTAADPDQFETLYAYSPYHRVNDETLYPSTLFVTAESDSRVDPMHARKMSARLMQAQSQHGKDATERPILLRLEANAGHGAGKPVSRLVDEFTDQLSFMLDTMGVRLAPEPMPPGSDKRTTK